MSCCEAAVDALSRIKEKVSVIDPLNSPDFDDYVAEFMEIRKKKKIDIDTARKTMMQPLFFGAMLVRRGKADVSVAGSINTTGDVLRAGIQIIGLKKGINTVSGAFMMTVPRYRDTENKVFMYGDSAVVPNPTVEQLASIVVSTAETHTRLTGEEARVAMLSFSTKGSGNRLQKSPRFQNRRQCNCPNIPRPRRWEYRLQTDRATRQCDRHRADHPGIGATGQRPLPGLFAR